MRLVNYRVYLTPEFWTITYNDEDFIRIRRKRVSEGFAFLLVEILMGLLLGKRTDLRDLWTLYKGRYDEAIHELSNHVRASADRVIELEYSTERRDHYLLDPKAEEARKLYFEFCERQRQRETNR